MSPRRYPARRPAGPSRALILSEVSRLESSAAFLRGTGKAEAADRVQAEADALRARAEVSR